MDYERDPNEELFDNVIEGSAGGGKAGGSSSGATESPNTLRSRATARFVELLCEGEIDGLIDGAKSIVINKVPVENSDGSRNWQGFSHVERKGTPDQDHIPGFPGVSSEQDVNLRVRNDRPVVYRTQSADLDAVRVTLNIPSLTKLDQKKGNLGGWNVSIAVDIKTLAGGGGAWVERVINDYISGKQTGPYERSYYIGLTGSGPWLVRMRRLTTDSDNDSTIQNITMFSHITEINDHKVAYADSAVVGIEVDAEQFGNGLAEREYDIRGWLMEYPSNYDPETRTYTGFWDGTFDYGYCNNPAWFFRKLAADPRAGADIPAALIDKWYLYELAKFCDEMVPDGKGGTEPRFVFNGEIRSRDEAYKVLQAIASMMRAIVFYNSGAVFVRHDAPMSPEHHIYTPANVIGDFNYSSTAKRVRHTAATVQWINPDIGYDPDYEVYEDRPAILKYGYNSLDLKAIGTTSQGQAYRQGKWAVLTELLQTESITFDVGFDSANMLPGDIFEVADPHWATADFGGRIINSAGPNLFSGSNAKISGWAGGYTIGSLYKPGPLGASNLRQATCASGGAVLRNSSSVTLVSGSTYTASIYVDRSSSQYAAFGNNSFGWASFDLKNAKVRLKSPGIADASIEEINEDLLRLVIVFAAPSTTGYVDFTAEASATAVSTTSNTLGANSNNGFVVYAGLPQIELGSVATPPMPGLTNQNTQVRLDRDIDFTGATSPQLHLTLLDGNLDDVANVDNTGRPARRQITYFSSNVASYDRETQIITLVTAIPAGNNDMITPLIWIFSKAQVAPRAYKLVSIKENEDKSYTVEGIEYSAEKFTKLDEAFNITYNPGDSFSNLPTTAFCPPPTNIKVEPNTVFKNGKTVASLMIGWDSSGDTLLRGHLVSYKRNDDNWVTLPIVFENSVEILDVPFGAFAVSVRAVNRFGVPSAELRGGINFEEVTVSSKDIVTTLTTERGDTTFSDKDLRLVWTAKSLSQDTRTPAIVAEVVKASGGLVIGAEATVTGGTPDNGSTGAAVVSLTNPNAPTITLSGIFGLGDMVRVTIGQNVFTYTNTVSSSASASSVATALAAVIDPDARFTASAASGVVTLGFTAGGTNATDIAGQNDALFKRYVVKILDPSTDAVKRTEYTLLPEYVYTFVNNQIDFTSASRSLKVKVSVEDVYGNLSNEKIVTFNNPAPSIPSVTATAEAGQLTLKYARPTDADWAAILVWGSQTNGFTPNAATLIFQGDGNPSIPVPPNGTFYYRYAFIDSFGQSGVTVSSQQSIYIPGVTATDLDTVAPATPTLPGSPLTSAVETDPVTNLPVIALTFTWNAVADSDLDSYEVEIKEGAGSFVGGFSASNTVTSLKFYVKGNTAYSARVRAVDKVGNRSSWSSTAGPTTTTKDSTAPAVPTSLSATASITGVFLSWTNPADLDLDKIEIWENSSNNSGTATRIATVNAIAGASGGYARSGLATGQLRYYWLKAVDYSGNTSGFSSVASATTAQVGTTDIAANAITAAKIAAGTITATEIQAGSLTGDRFNTTTSLPGTITVGVTGVSIGTVESRASDPAARINALSTVITPGLIQISGSTTLADWRQGGDLTRIAGGQLSANTVTANKVSIGLRGIDIQGLEFECNRIAVGSTTVWGDWLAWSAGTISYVDNSGTAQTQSINSGYFAGTSAYVQYVYWTPGNNALSTTSSAATAYSSGNIVLATYKAGTDLVATYGRTIIDGSKITVDTITANRIKSGEIFTQDLYVGGTTFKLAGANGGANKGALLIKNSGGTVDLVTLGWIDASTVGFRMRNAAGNIVVDHTYDPIASGAGTSGLLTAIGSGTTVIANGTYKSSGTHGAYQGGAVGPAQGNSCFISSSIINNNTSGYITAWALDDDATNYAATTSAVKYCVIVTSANIVYLYEGSELKGSYNIPSVTSASRGGIYYDGATVFAMIDGVRYGNIAAAGGQALWPKVLDYYLTSNTSPQLRVDIQHGPYNVERRVGASNLLIDGSFDVFALDMYQYPDGGAQTITRLTGGNGGGSFMRLDVIGGNRFTDRRRSFVATQASMTVGVDFKDSGVAGSWGVGGYPDRPHGIGINLATSVGGTLATTAPYFQLAAGQGWTRFHRTFTGLTIGQRYWIAFNPSYYEGIRKLDIDNLCVTVGDSASAYLDHVNDIKLRNPGQNLLDMSLWGDNNSLSANAGGRLIYSHLTVSTETDFIDGVGPDGVNERIMRCVNDTANGTYSGGIAAWKVENEAGLDPTKPILMTAYVKAPSGSASIAYLGAMAYETMSLAGVEDSNPYFISGNYPNGASAGDGEWWLWVGLIHANSYAGADLGISGIYNPRTGQRVYDGAEFKSRVTAHDTQASYRGQDLRLFAYGSASGDTLYIARPSVRNVLDPVGEIRRMAADVTAAQQITIEVAGDKTVAADYTGAVTGQMPVSFSPAVKRGGNSIKTAAGTTYAIYKLSDGTAGADGGTATVDNTAGSSTKGDVSISAFASGSNEVKFRLVVTVDGVAQAPITRSLKKNIAPPPSGSGSGSGAKTVTANQGANSTTYVACSSDANPQVTITTGLKIYVSGIVSYQTSGSGAAGRTGTFKNQYSTDNSTWTDFGSALTGSTSTSGFTTVEGEFIDGTPGSRDLAQNVTPANGTYYVRTIFQCNTTGRTITLLGDTITYEAKA